MSVKTAGAEWTYEFKGTAYYFCSEGCKTEFEKSPEKYLAAGAAAPAKEMEGCGGFCRAKKS